MASPNDSYWSKSWSLLTRDEGWYKPLLVLAAAKLIPIVGPFGVDGYGLEWARLTSWGVDSSPKQKNVDVGACIKSGARAFVVVLGYGFVFGLLRALLAGILGPIGGLLAAAITVFGGVFMIVAKLRATIYQTIGSGFQLERIIDMIKHDYMGLLKVSGLYAILMLVISMLGAVLFGGVLISNMGSVFVELAMNDNVNDTYVAAKMLSALASAMPALCILSYPFMVATTFVQLIMDTAVGLWMRQFDVQNWGNSHDPIPVLAQQAAKETAPAQQAAPAVTTPSQPAQAPVPAPAAPAAPAPAPVQDDYQQPVVEAPHEVEAAVTATESSTAAEAAGRAVETSTDFAVATTEDLGETQVVKTFSLDDVVAPAEAQQGAAEPVTTEAVNEDEPSEPADVEDTRDEGSQVTEVIRLSRPVESEDVQAEGDQAEPDSE